MVLKLFTDTGSYALPTEPTWRKSVNQGTTRHVRSFPRSWAGLAGPGGLSEGENGSNYKKHAVDAYGSLFPMVLLRRIVFLFV